MSKQTHIFKTCRACGEIKPIVAFSSCKQNKDGAASYCRECAAEKAREWRQKHPGGQSAAQARYLANPENAAKHRARMSHAQAVRSGKITPPETCPLCKKNGRKIHAHHIDYSRPLFVFYMCSECHGRLNKMKVAELLLLYAMFAPGYRTPEERLSDQEDQNAA